MRPIEQIKADIDIAMRADDAPMLVRYADELDEHKTPSTASSALNARGVACLLTKDYTNALTHLSAALALCQELGNTIGLATIHGNIGNVYRSLGNYSVALEHYNRGLEYQIEIGDHKGIATVTGSIGYMHALLYDYPAALEFDLKALALFYELGDRSGIAWISGNIGLVYLNIGDYPTALEHLNHAVELHLELGNRRPFARVTANVGNVFFRTGDHRAALDHYNRALGIHRENNDLLDVAVVTANIGNVYNEAGDYSMALEHFNAALAIHREIGDLYGITLVTNNRLLVLLSLNDLEGARTMLAALDELQTDTPYHSILREVNRANLRIAEGDLQSAETALHHALDLATTTSLRAEQVEIHKQLRDLAQKRNDFASYIEHNNEYTRIADEILGKETTIKLAMHAKEREIAEKEKETAKQIAVLHSTLPKHIADRVVRGEVVNDQYDKAAVLFLDIVGFTTLSSSMNAPDVVALLDAVFSKCDAAMAEHGLVKIKTIGDMYMAVAFENITYVAQAALDILQAITEVPVRIGIHCGPVVAGVLGKERLQYDVWGDTVNIASRMESTGKPGRIHISQAFAEVLQGDEATGSPDYRITERGSIEVKGKGMMTTFWLEQ